MLVDKTTVKKLTKLSRSLLDSKGREIPNPKPLSMPSGLDRPPTLQEQIQRVLRTELSQQAAAQGEETFEEANDFDVQDDFESDIVETAYTLMTDEFIEEAKIANDIANQKDKQEMERISEEIEQEESKVKVEKETGEEPKTVKS